MTRAYNSAASYDDDYDSDAEWSQIQAEISNFVNSSEHSEEHDDNSSVKSEYSEEQDDSGVYNSFDFDSDTITNFHCHWVPFRLFNLDRSYLSKAEFNDDSLSENFQPFVPEASEEETHINWVPFKLLINSDQSDLSDAEFNDDLLSENFRSVVPEASEEETDNHHVSQLEEEEEEEKEEEIMDDVYIAAGQKWIVSDSVRIFERMYHEIKNRNKSVFIEYYDLRRADKEILITLGREIRNRAGIPYVEYLVYFDMLHTAIFQEQDRIQRGESGHELGDELDEGKIKALFLSILEEFDRRFWEQNSKRKFLRLSLDEAVEVIDYDELLSEISAHLETRVCKGDQEGDHEICNLCNDRLCHESEKETTTIIVTLECGHEYHVNCIEPWMKTKNICPTCKAIVFVPEFFKGRPCLRGSRN